MSNLSNYSRDFDSVIRSRGDTYFRDGRVKIISIHPGQEALFKVHGSQFYQVRLRLGRNKELISSCTCPYFEGGYNCKHAWASLLEANRHGFFTPSEKQLKSNLPAKLDSPDDSKKAGKISNNRETLLPSWRAKLEKFNTPTSKTSSAMMSPSFGKQSQSERVGYIAIDQALTEAENKWVLKFYTQEYKKTGELGVLKSCSVNHDQISLYGDELDRRALLILLGQRGKSSNQYNGYYNHEPKTDYVYLESNVLDPLFVELGRKNKLLFKPSFVDPKLLQFENDPLKIHLTLDETSTGFALTAQMKNGTLAISLREVLFYLDPYILSDSTLFTTDFRSHEEWFYFFRKNTELNIPKKDIDSFLDFYFKAFDFPSISLPESLAIRTSDLFSKVRFSIDSDPLTGCLLGQVQFQYAEEFVSLHSDTEKIYHSGTRTLFVRNVENELTEIVRFQEAIDKDGSALVENFQESDHFLIPEGKLEAFVDLAFNMRWDVVAFKKKLVQSKGYTSTIKSGIDWFDLSAEFKFENGFIATLPELLQGIKSGQRFIFLADGTAGVIRKDWIKKFSNVSQSGKIVDDELRLTKIQALFFGAELSEDKNFKSDRKFKSLQKIVDGVNSIDEVPIDPRFQGKLRTYQRRGLSWLNLMAKHEIGSVLADDMGLGKTIQILAAISKIKNEKSLIIAPKSLVYNWINEAKKFTPHLKFHNHTGIDRMDRLEELDKAQVIVTTYQTFSLDIELFKEIDFDFFILDEAHYIKNAESQAYMACRLIKAKKKIALTGTPVENSLRDLFSILSIVTPGLILDSLVEKYATETDPEAIQALAKSLRPFILRRTKDEVLKDLPKKSEQILFCDLSSAERKKYNELKAYYWNSLNGKIKEKGFQKSKIEILEALLRLRQASCHPGLLNKNLTSASSSKFDLLLEQLVTIISDGHKALVFSQFTGLLGLLRQALDKRNIPFEYLDGKTSNRAERVKNFQENDSLKVFLISLKAGGVGLNLTSADYVFILDPWWNPAAEAQAIDRAHRFGQKKKVFAYKIIAKNTVEEKILAMQEQKRALAKAVISSEKGLFKGLKMEDLKELFL